MNDALKLAAELRKRKGKLVPVSLAASLLEQQHAALESLRSKNAELERLCDETYVAQGADAYNHACSEMARWQKERLNAGKDAGCEGSLCDGMAWLYGQIEQLEAEVESLRAGRAVPGWQLVPVEPTREMMDAMPGLPAIGAAGDMDLKNLGWSLKEIKNRHRWMGAIAATPTPPAQAAADARDAERWRMAVLIKSETLTPPDHRKNQQALNAYIKALGGGIDFQGAIDAALATHQQRQGGAAIAASGRQE